MLGLFVFYRVKPIHENGVCSVVMRLCFKVVVLGISLLPLVAEATSGDFSNISVRNVFRLLPPKVEQKPPEIQPELPQLMLQGVTTLLDSRQALLKIQGKGRPTATEVCCILREGQELDGVRVLRIEMESATVWLMNQGVEQILALKR